MWLCACVVFVFLGGGGRKIFGGPAVYYRTGSSPSILREFWRSHEVAAIQSRESLGFGGCGVSGNSDVAGEVLLCCHIAQMLLSDSLLHI